MEEFISDDFGGSIETVKNIKTLIPLLMVDSK